MTKRKSQASKGESSTKESRGRKQGRGAAAADAATAASEQAAAAEAMRLLKLAPQRAIHTLRLVEAMRGTDDVLERVKATCALLEEDGKRANSLLDMSLLVDGDEVSHTSESAARTLNNGALVLTLARL